LTLEDVGSGYAVYVLSRAVHMLRLTDGCDVLLTRPATGPVHAQLQPSGVHVSSRHGVHLHDDGAGWPAIWMKKKEATTWSFGRRLLG
jgi:hypothetical protein